GLRQYLGLPNGGAIFLRSSVLRERGHTFRSPVTSVLIRLSQIRRNGEGIAGYRAFIVDLLFQAQGLIDGGAASKQYSAQSDNRAYSACLLEMGRHVQSTPASFREVRT